MSDPPLSDTDFKNKTASVVFLSRFCPDFLENPVRSRFAVRKKNCRKILYIFLDSEKNEFLGILKITVDVSKRNDNVNISKSKDLYVEHLHKHEKLEYLTSKLSKS